MSRIPYSNVAESSIIMESSQFLQILIDFASDKKYYKTAKQNYFLTLKPSIVETLLRYVV
jgi:hypothetical protein